ncbi:uncharacterized protein [Coffea arabica]|uniref:Retrotransposon gag domain-containing protein n=1 Tax=Coffea arabica TaxID=13443 RepID=A0ABM4WML1_COFAR
MEFKKVNFSLEGLVADVSTTQETQYTAPLTRSKAKKLAEKAKANVVTEEANFKMLPNKKGAHDESIDSPSDSAASVVMPVMMTNTTTVEDQISNLVKIVEGLVVHAQSQDTKIVKLMAMVKNIGESSLSMSKQKSKVPDEGDSSSREKEKEDAKSQATKEFSISPDGTIHVDNLKEFIEGTIKDKIGGGTKSYSGYTKSYTARVESLKMPVGYQPPKFQQFDGKGNPKQHIAHFVETCNNAGIDGDLLVKQFVRSLKGNAFDWYTDLESGTIDSWEQLEHEFLSRFYSTKRTVSMTELSNTHQWKSEPVIDFIDRWRNLSLNCKDRISESSAIEMCIQGMHWGLRYILQGVQPETFDELSTKAHKLEINLDGQEPPVPDPHKAKERQEARKGGKPPFKNEKKEAMATSVMPFKVVPKTVRREDNKINTHQEQGKRKPTLKEMQDKEYPFLDSDVSGMFDDLLSINLITLSEMKRPDEARNTDDPNYCKYHRLIGHPIQKCFVFKDKVMELARQGKILLEEDKASVNQTSIGSLQSMEDKRIMVPVLPIIQFGSLDPTEIKQEGTHSTLQEHVYEDEKALQPDVDDEGWTLVTRRRRRKSYPSSKASKVLTRSMVTWKKKEKDVKKTNDCRNLQGGRIFKQKSRTPITLKEFLPKKFFDVDVVASHTTRVDHIEEQKDNARKSLCEMARASIGNEGGRVPTSNEEVNVTSITFTSEDLLLGSTPHNRPLFVTGYAKEQKVNRMLIDGGSAVNILPLKTLKELGIPVDELSNSRLMIQGFNQGGQRALGSLNLEIVIDDMTSKALLYVIDAKTTYNVLLGRPWIHENGVVPSTLHQCFKYCQNGVARSVKADGNPFTEAEAYIADAKFYIKRHIAKDKTEQPLSGDKIQNPESPNAKGEKVMTSKSKEEVHEETDVSLPNNESVVFRCPPKSRVEHGQSPAIQHETLKDLTLPITHLDTKRASSSQLKMSNFLSKESEVEQDTIPKSRTKEGFDPIAYKLLAKAGYDLKESAVLNVSSRQSTSDMIHGLNPTQKMLKEKGYAVENSKFGLGYSSPTPIRIKINRVSSQYIAVENESSQIVGKSQVFHEKENKIPRISVFKRLGPQKRQKSQNSHKSKGKMAKSLQNLEEPSDCPHKFGSIIPSRMRRCTDLVINCGTELRVREHTVMYTRPKEDDEESVASCNHITIIDGDSPEEEDDAEDAPPELEEGVKATVDDLKEINLGTSEDPRPIYISASLSPDEEKAYIELLREYQDVFAWTYKEMPGLDPKVAVHHLAVKKGVRPVKQAQRRFRPDLIPLIEMEVNKLIESGFIREVKYPT